MLGIKVRNAITNVALMGCGSEVRQGQWSYEFLQEGFELIESYCRETGPSAQLATDVHRHSSIWPHLAHVSSNYLFVSLVSGTQLPWPGQCNQLSVALASVLGQLSMGGH